VDVAAFCFLHVSEMPSLIQEESTVTWTVLWRRH